MADRLSVPFKGSTITLDGRHDGPQEAYQLLHAAEIPHQVSSLAFGHAGHLFVGSSQGELHVYDLSSFKVLKAVRGLGAEVSSIACVKRPGSELRDAWLACGRSILKFKLDSSKDLQTREDEQDSVEIGESDDDVLNEIALNVSKSHLAFSTDSGHVGVVDLSAQGPATRVAKMMVKHESVCGSVKFISEWPWEIVSAGYDRTVRHFDFKAGKELSRYEIPPYVSVGGMALSPPFVMSLAVSPRGKIAAGTADGRLWLGLGGEKLPSERKKGKKKWEGLQEEASLTIKVAEGPVVAMAFDESDVLTVSSHLGQVMRFRCKTSLGRESVEVDKIWWQKTERVEKVNALVVDEKRVVIGGLTAGGRGVFEIWRKA